MRLASGPASNQPCGRPSWTRFSSSPRLLSPAALPPVRLAPRLRPCLRSALRPTLGTCIRLSLPVPALRRCRRLGLRLAFGPASIWSPARAFSSSSGLNLQLLVVCRFSGRRRASVRACALRSLPFGPPFSLALRFRPQFGLASAPAGFALRLRSAPGLRPSLPLNPPAAFRLRHSTKGSRPSSPAFPSGQPSGLPLSGVRLSPLRLRCEAALWHAFDLPLPLAFACGSNWPSVPVSRTRAPFSGPPAIGLRLVPPQTAPALRPSPLAAANSLRPVDLRALDPHRACAPLDPPSRLLPRAFGLRLAPVGNRPPGPASASPAC